MARVASELLRQAVGALDELDTSLRGVLRSLISYMVEDPRTARTCATPRLSPRSSHNGAGGAISLSQPGLTLA
jgi:hypothetical protein